MGRAGVKSMLVQGTSVCKSPRARSAWLNGDTVMKMVWLEPSKGEQTGGK